MAEQSAHEKAMASINAMFDPPETTEQETPAAVQEDEQESAPAEGAQAEAAQQEPGKQPEETEATREVEIDGETYIVPAKIAERFIQHADYTRKTQDVAEMRRALSAEREASQLEKAFEQSVKDEQKQLTLIEASLEQFRKLDWGKVEDTAQLLHLRAQFDQLKDAKAEVEKSIGAKRADFEGKVKEKASEAQLAGQKYIESKVKGFTDDTKQELFAYGLNEGYTRDELDRIVDPRIVITLWKARQWDALQATKPSVTKRASQAAPVVKPGATQPQASKSQVLTKVFRDAKGKQEKVRAAEDYFANLLGGGR